MPRDGGMASKVASVADTAETREEAAETPLLDQIAVAIKKMVSVIQGITIHPRRRLFLDVNFIRKILENPPLRTGGEKSILFCDTPVKSTLPVAISPDPQKVRGRPL